MNEKVQAFLDERNAALQAEEQKKREENLISLGLFEEKKEYADPPANGYSYPYTKYDKEKDNYYRIKQIAIQVTDEEYARILEVMPKAE